MITDEEYRILMTDVYRKIVTAVNITTGDDGTKAHKVIETFTELWKKKKSTFEPDFCAVKLEDNPWIVQPFEIYEEIRIEDIKKKHQK